MLHNSSNIVVHRSFTAYPNESKLVVLNDAVEGDIYFYFKIIYSIDSQTTINIRDPHNAEVVISMGASERTLSSTPIRLGTYQNFYELYLEYEISPANAMGKHEVVVSFVAKRQENGSR